MIELFFIAISFILTVCLMPSFIHIFNKKKIGQTTREDGPLWHQVKTGTPTMGGTVFVFAILLTLSIFSVYTQSFNYQTIMLFLTFLLFGGIGFVDDFISIFKKQNEGLTAKQKFISQIVFSILISLIGFSLDAPIAIPFFSVEIKSFLLVALFTFFWITGFSNAVNLTDGLDGLATGLSMIAYASYAFLSYQQGEVTLALICLIIVSALTGFLIFNKRPAKIFMGDVGSLALGAGLAVISLILNRPWSLLIIGFVFVVETLSVILQVTSFKLTGKRLLKMSPIHHHFEMIGWSERKVVGVFWLVGLLSSVIYLVVGL
ncbi:phospho-N-acetylmuramoyl-pentapeptide-transferase [Hutsoniella sourekii]|uniref:phospho-N-acetylmuramoyl-pentapeptide- transferase n=1 Tax=Hutsoniella sourekii TaxID=87650 RepID=UPI0004880D55|nr:phospho-N-acetylmuramoyl-pentapeptide-transferase [Hutsoniella sourekii]